MKTQNDAVHYPHLNRQQAFNLVSDAEPAFHAIEGLAQALIDVSSSDAMPVAQGHGVYCVAMAIRHQYSFLNELHSQLFHGLHSDAKGPGANETKGA